MTERSRLRGPATSRRALLAAIPLLLGGLAVGRTYGAPPEIAPAFPIALRPGKRFLVDANGAPFLLHGDTAWSLFVQITREEVDLYLDDRRARGFNTILASLLEHHYSSHPPANAYGDQPFLEPGNYATPNEAYFSHADWVLRRAAEKGFLVLLTPSYAGCCGDGWYAEMLANGPRQLRQYGKYLGQRYRDFTNILWVHSGDSDVPEKELVIAIVQGIRRFDRRALHTAHGQPDTVVLDFWQDQRWLQVNNVYTYGPVHAPALAAYERPERKPFILIESAYENEYEASEQRLRTQAYQAMLCGAAGQVFGNNPLWHFNGGGVYDGPGTWQEALGSRGAQSMTHLRDLLTSLRWWKLRPERDNQLLTEGLGDELERAVAARSVDRSFALLYLPNRREITVNLRRLAGRRVTARWYDPSNGQFSTVSGSPLRRNAPQRLAPPGTNRAGLDDWVLLLEARP
jgi:hypothetical protein